MASFASFWQIFLLSLLVFLSGVQSSSQISLSVGPDGFSSMNITWVTDNRRALPEIVYGTDPSKLISRVQGSTTFYDFASAANKSQASGGIHHATLGGLQSSTTYYYQVGDVATGMWSTVLSFTTLPLPASLQRPFSFAVIGDLGQTADSRTTVAQMADDPDLRLVVHVGDMAYADTDQARWDTYGEYVQVLSSRTPWMVSAGNHEIESDTETGANFVPYQHRFNMPALAPPVMEASPGQVGCVHLAHAEQVDCTPSDFMSTYDYGNSFFSYNAATAHFVTLNPYTHSDLDSPQGQWLLSDLSKVNRSETQWLIVVTHCPFYNSNSHHQNESQAIEMKKNMESLFLAAGVDVVITGHVHAYERVYPVAHGKVTPSGITYLGVGGAGNREGHAGPFETPIPQWSAARNDQMFGHGKLTIHNATHLHWVWFANTAKRSPYDETWVVREETEGFHWSDPVTRKTYHFKA